MKPFVFIYCEGSDTKIAVISNEKDGMKIHQTFAVELAQSEGGTPEAEQVEDFGMDDLGGDISFDSMDSDDGMDSGDMGSADFTSIAASLMDVKLNQATFVPIITEPTLNYHVYEGPREDDKSKLIDSILKDIQNTKGFFIAKDSIDCVELNGDHTLSVFVEGEIPCVTLINSLASYNKKRYYKIGGIKSAEISLAYYVSKTTKFYPEDFSLIIYTGKEYSKLIFLEGQKLKHIGSTLDIGTQNLHTYDVYFSKILLEMENGGIPRLDNVILCGEDRSENLVLSFYGTFPEANVTELKFDNLAVEGQEENNGKDLSAFSIPIAAAIDYFDSQSKEYDGVSILPKYIVENQKFLQFGWHSYAIMPIIFAATFYFTYHILGNYQEMDILDKEISRLKLLQQQNQELVNQISPLAAKIANFDKTQAILDSATTGTEVWGSMLDRVSSFVERRRNFWISSMSTPSSNQLSVKGYSLSRSALTEFAEYNNSSLLQNINYEPLRERNAFAYTLEFRIDQKEQNLEEDGSED